LDVLLDIAKLARSTYYYHLANVDKPDKYHEVKKDISSIFHESKGRYGYRRITLELNKTRNSINHKTVQRLMKELGISCLVRVKKYKSYKGKVGNIAPNIINRKFSATKPNRKWVTDVTEFALFGKKIYLFPILDLYNREIISFDVSDRPVYKQVQNMIDKAFKKHDNLNGLVLHSD
jgi:transposase InsO family protein